MRNTIILCLFLTGCSAGIQPSLDFGPEPVADASTSDAAVPGPDADVHPDGSLELDAGDDLGQDLDADPPPVDLGTDAPAPDLGPAPCTTLVPTILCVDARCCNRPCDADGTCARGFAVSGSFCTCENVECGDTECAYGSLTCCL